MLAASATAMSLEAADVSGGSQVARAILTRQGQNLRISEENLLVTRHALQISNDELSTRLLKAEMQKCLNHVIVRKQCICNIAAIGVVL